MSDGAANPNHHNHSRTALLRWIASLGAVTAEALAVREGIGVPSARGHLRAAAAKRLLVRHRPLADGPALYTATRAGLRAADVEGIEPCTVSAAGAAHLIECARVAAALERRYPDHTAQGERELRAAERSQGTPLASAQLSAGVGGGSCWGARWHRPDLVLWPAAHEEPPVAVEVELTVKAPARLQAICRAWARARCVAGVLYLAPPEVERAVGRAIDRAHAGERVVVVPLDSLAA
ncbi:MAG TPA: hypothetical protein VNV37_03230 [Solirubrobacteraceae bacterium]|jgi:hypothetical protein|nr:hypothetical protein [Solirubrobacteraceae bacterium]